MTNDMVAKLKDPKQAQPFWLRSSEEQAVLKQAGQKNTLAVRRSSPDGEQNITPICCWSGGCYILKPDWQPEPPKLIEREVRLLDETYYGITHKGSNFTISDAIELPGFRGFYDADGTVISFITAVTSIIENDFKVFARFEE